MRHSAFTDYPGIGANAVICFQKTSIIKTPTFTATGQGDAIKTQTPTYTKLGAIQHFFPCLQYVKVSDFFLGSYNLMDIEF